MAKRLLVIPDVHGETFWKEPVLKYIEQVDRIIFLGDYLDPYRREGRDYSLQGLYGNLMDIIDFKRAHMEKVVLLKGNHDQHYASRRFRDLACGSRCDIMNWSLYSDVFFRNEDIFKIVHREEINGTPYLFSHAGLTLHWISMVNTKLWKQADNEVSLSAPAIIERINALDDDDKGQELLAIIGRCRASFGEKSGSILWADVKEHDIPDAPEEYGLNKVFQVFGHTRLRSGNMIVYDHLAMIDSQQCFMIDEGLKERIVTLQEYLELHDF